MKKNAKWTLYRRIFSAYKFFAWVNPEGVIAFARATAPHGWINADLSHLEGKTRQEALPSGEGWKPHTHTMTQEELAKGWLIP